MLILTRKLNEQIVIGDDVRVTVVRLKGNVVKLGIDAPQSVGIRRGELQPRPEVMPDEEGD